MLKEDDRVEITYPPRAGVKGTVTKVVERQGHPALICVAMDHGTDFICDETMVKLCGLT